MEKKEKKKARDKLGDKKRNGEQENNDGDEESER